MQNKRLLIAFVSVVCLASCETTTPSQAYRPATVPPQLQFNRTDNALQQAATRAAKISQRAGRTIRVHFDDVEGIAAQCGLCTDGPNIYVNTAFLKKYPPEYQVAVLAHEFAHGDLGHVTMRAALAGGLDAVATTMKPADEWSSSAMLVYGVGKALTVNSVGRQAEHQADLYAAQRLQHANLSRDTMAKALEYTRDLLGNTGGGWFSTHPLTDERIHAVRHATH